MFRLLNVEIIRRGMQLDENALCCLQAQMTLFPKWQEDCRAA